MFFEGICICTADLPSLDNAAIQAGVESCGGMYRRELTKEVTHLLVLAKDSKKYRVAMEFGVQDGLQVVLPHWFEECIKLRQLVPTDLYLFPTPAFFDLPPSVSANLAVNMASPIRNHSSPNKLIPFVPCPPFDRPVLESTDNDLIYQKTAVVNRMQNEGALPANPNNSGALIGSLAPPTESKPTPSKVFPPHVKIPVAAAQIFKGRKVYIANLSIRNGLTEALKERIIEAGGECWSWSLDLNVETGADQWEKRRQAEEILLSCNTVIMRNREGWEYWMSYEGKKTIGNIAWLYHVLSISSLTSPLDRLLHYPFPSLPPPGASLLEITISNYVSAKRDYVRTLIECLGATFTGSMSKTATHVVTANLAGDKVDFANRWSTPIVTHLYIEACLSQWKIVDIDASETFLPTAAGLDMTMEIGVTPLSAGAIERWCELPESKKAKIAALVPIPILVREETLPEQENEVIHKLPVEEERIIETIDTQMMQSFGGGEESLRLPRGVASPLKSPSKQIKVTIDSEDESVKIAGPKVFKKNTVRIVEEESEEEDDDELIADETVENITRFSPEKINSPTKASKGKGKEVEINNLMDLDDEDDTRDTDEVTEEVELEDTEYPSMAESSKKATTSKVITPKRKLISQSTPQGKTHNLRSDPASSASKLPSSGNRGGIDTSAILARGVKRSAANQAIGKLKIQMTDKNSYDSEIKMNSGRKDKNGKRSIFAVRSDTEEGSEESEVILKRPSRRGAEKLSRKVLDTRMESSDESGVVSSFDASMKVKPVSKTKVALPTAKLYFTKTGLDLDSESSELVKLKKLGAEEATSKHPATVIIVKSLIRTKTFLLAMVNGPIVINQSWIHASLKADKLLDPTEFLLQDKSSETKFGVKLAEVLERARNGKLFENKTITITPGCKNRSVLVEIIEAHGGAISSRLPSLSEISDPDRYVVSGMEERKKWEALAAKGCAIYTTEAVLMSTMRQLPLEESQDRCDLRLQG